MSLHDRMVLTIALGELLDGSDTITIGDGVVSRLPICYILKMKFPRRKIETYIDDALVEVL